MDQSCRKDLLINHWSLDCPRSITSTPMLCHSRDIQPTILIFTQNKSNRLKGSGSDTESTPRKQVCTTSNRHMLPVRRIRTSHHLCQRLLQVHSLDTQGMCLCTNVQNKDPSSQASRISPCPILDHQIIKRSIGIMTDGLAIETMMNHINHNLYHIQCIKLLIKDLNIKMVLQLQFICSKS